MQIRYSTCTMLKFRSMTISNPMSPIRFVNRSAPTVGCGVEFCFCVQTALTIGQKLTVKGVLGCPLLLRDLHTPKSIRLISLRMKCSQQRRVHSSKVRRPLVVLMASPMTIGRQCDMDVGTRAFISLQPRMTGHSLLKLGRRPGEHTDDRSVNLVFGGGGEGVSEALSPSGLSCVIAK